MTLLRPTLLWLALLLPALAGTAAAAGLKQEITITAEVVRLGDIFTDLPPEKAALPIAQAPRPGESVELDARWLGALASRHGVAWQPLSPLDRARLSRASRLVEAREVERLVGAALVGGTYEILLDDPALLLHLPAAEGGRLELAGFSRVANGGRFTASLVYRSGDVVTAQVPISGRALQLVDVPVLSRRLTAGEVVTAADIAWQAMRADRLAENSLLAPESILGKSLRRHVPAGQPLRGSDLGEPILVAKNALVLLQLQTARMQLSAQGRALEAGAEGSVVRVMNSKSNSIVSGTVIAPGVVEVTGAAAMARR